MSARQRQRITDNLLAALVKLFTVLGSWRDKDQRAFLRQAVPLVRAGQLSIADMVATEMSASAGVARPISIPASTVTDLRGVDPAEVYARPFATVHTALSEGKALNEAVDNGISRLQEVAEGDMQLAYAHANQQAMQRLPEPRQPRFWRRVLQGEENCALCIVAASNRYTIEDLNPIHPGCDCDVEPVFGRDDTRAEDDARLERVHEAIQELTGKSPDELARGGRAIDYRQLIVAEHGELGGMLVKPRDRFSGPSAIPQRSNKRGS